MPEIHAYAMLAIQSRVPPAPYAAETQCIQKRRAGSGVISQKKPRQCFSSSKTQYNKTFI
jgi:hypothetical protein